MPAAVLTIPATGNGFPRFLILDHAADHKRYDHCQYDHYYRCSHFNLLTFHPLPVPPADTG